MQQHRHMKLKTPNVDEKNVKWYTFNKDLVVSYKTEPHDPVIPL